MDANAMHNPGVGESHHSIFHTPGLQFLSCFIHFFGVTVITYFIACRLTGNIFTAKWWERISWPRLCVLLVLVDSYLFILSAGLLIFGIGMQLNHLACAAGIYLCVAFYTTSKILIYLFLSEKVFVVWAAHGVSRVRSPVYLICVGTITLYVAVMLAMFFGRISEFRDSDESCVIGLKPIASIPLLSYDLFINVLLTSLFLWPIFRVKFANPRLKRVATRTLVASIAALTTSCINIAILAILDGRELGWVCLGSCGSDVVFNAAALFWCTAANDSALSNRSQLTTVDPRDPGRSSTPSTLPTGGAGTVGSTFGNKQASRSMSQRSNSHLKPLHLLRPRTGPAALNRGTGRIPSDLQIHVTSTSESHTSPPARTIDLEESELGDAESQIKRSSLGAGVVEEQREVPDLEEVVMDVVKRHSELSDGTRVEGKDEDEMKEVGLVSPYV
ncbi:hypothetical protein MKEN_00239200 [Mycena kentingensis (nom. inval.)]|nr:hypothetical protein MKEN_00239200 [Mycena kentingensis (nom. inval.)]